MPREMPLPMRLACLLPTNMAPRTAKMVRSYRLKLSLAQLAPNKFHFDSEYSQAMGYLKAMDDAEIIDWDTWKELLDEAVALLRSWRAPSPPDELEEKSHDHQ